MTEPRPPRPGDTLGDFTLKETLGAGAMATVYLGERRDSTQAAIKVLHAAKLETDEVRRFKRELEALKRLDHTNIVKVLASGTHGIYPWIALEYVKGKDLEQVLSEWQKASPPDRFAQVDQILRALCKALTHIHDCGMVHRDLKPSNILIRADGEIKLSDFGVVKNTDLFSTHLTTAGRLVGTIAYMAPELITSEDPDHRVDLYSLGAVAYALLVGRRPFEADSIAGFLAQHLTARPVPPTQLNPNIPPLLERVCLRLLEREPSQRPQTAAQVLAQLDGHRVDTAKTIHGRGSELGTLNRQLRQLSRGVGGLTLLEGNDGSGRSRILERTVERARDLGGIRLLTGGANNQRIGRHLLEQVIGEQSEHLNENTCVERLLTELAGIKTLVAIDDIDRLPIESRRTLRALVKQHIADNGDAMLFIGSRVTPKGFSALSTWEDATGITPSIVRVKPLTLEATVAILRDEGLSYRASSTLGSRLHQELGGLPGDILEQLRALIDKDLIKQEHGNTLRLNCSLEELEHAPLPLPKRIVQEQIAQFEKLEPQQQRVLAALAVIGGESSIRLVALVIGAAEALVIAALRAPALEHAAVIREEGLDRLVQLKDPRMQRVVLSMLPQETKSQIHRSVAAGLTQLHRRRTRVAGLIADHLIKGDRPLEAWPLLIDAAWRAQRLGDLNTARERLDRALAAVPLEQVRDVEAHQKHLAQLMILQGERLAHVGLFIDAFKAFEAGCESARAAADLTLLCRALTGVGEAANIRGNYSQADEAFSEALKLASEGSPFWPRATLGWVTCRVLSKQPTDIDDLLDRVEVVASGARNSPIPAQSKLLRALAELVKGNRADAVHYMERSESIARSARERNGVLQTLSWQTQFALTDGGYRRAIELAREAGSLSSQLTHSFLGEWVRGLQAIAAWRSGDQGLATEIANHSGGVTKKNEPILPAMRVLLYAGQFDRVGTILERLDVPLSRRPRCDAMQFTALHGHALAACDPVRARALLERAETLQANAIPEVAAQSWLDLAHAWRALNQTAQSQAAAKQGLSALGTEPPIGLALELALFNPELDAGLVRIWAQTIGTFLSTSEAEMFRGRTGIRTVLEE